LVGIHHLVANLKGHTGSPTNHRYRVLFWNWCNDPKYYSRRRSLSSGVVLKTTDFMALNDEFYNVSGQD
jgi:hypothetical protein